MSAFNSRVARYTCAVAAIALLVSTAGAATHSSGGDRDHDRGLRTHALAMRQEKDPAGTFAATPTNPMHCRPGSYWYLPLQDDSTIPLVCHG